MSNKTSALNKVIQVVKRWPDDSNRVYASFKKFHLERLQELQKGSETKLPSAAHLDAQALALQQLASDANSKKFPVSEALMAPEGMPNYYQRIMQEADKDTQQKESFLTSFREAAFGWFK